MVEARVCKADPVLFGGHLLNIHKLRFIPNNSSTIFFLIGRVTIVILLHAVFQIKVRLGHGRLNTFFFFKLMLVSIMSFYLQLFTPLNHQSARLIMV